MSVSGATPVRFNARVIALRGEERGEPALGDELVEEGIAVHACSHSFTRRAT